MKTSLLLSAALAAILLPMPMKVAHAQVEQTQANTRAARRAKEAQQGKQAPLFPQATREEPKQSGNSALAKALGQLFDLQKEGKNDEALVAADALLADPKATPYDRATAAYVAGYVWLNKDTQSYANAINYIQRAITENGLSNNTHYQTMLQLAQMQINEEKFVEGLASADRYLNETHSEDPKAYSLKANTLYQLKRYPESVEAVKKAIATTPEPDENLIRLLTADYLEMDKPLEAAKVIEELLAKKPNDKALLQNLASVYQQSGDNAKAGQVFDRMRSGGMLTESKDYENAYRLLANIEGREKDALLIIEEGLKKGVLQPSFEVYSYQGNVYYNADQIPQAIDAWTKAAPLAKDGETYLNLAKLHISEEHWTDAKSTAQQALAKGVKKKGEAWLVVGRAEFGLGNKSAVLEAYKEAAKYPESKKAAEEALNRAAGK